MIDTNVLFPLTSTGGGGAPQVQSDWNQSDSTAVDFIKNKPTIPSVASAVASGENGYTTGDQVHTALQSAGNDVWNAVIRIHQNGASILIYKNGILTTPSSGKLYVSFEYSKSYEINSGSSWAMEFTPTNTGIFNIIAQSGFNNIIRNNEYNYYRFTFKESSLSSEVLCCVSMFANRPASAISSGDNGYTTGNQVYNAIQDAAFDISNLETETATPSLVGMEDIETALSEI